MTMLVLGDLFCGICQCPSLPNYLSEERCFGKTSPAKIEIAETI